MEDVEIRLRCLEMAVRFGVSNPTEKAEEFLRFVAGEPAERKPFENHPAQEVISRVAELHGSSPEAICGAARYAHLVRIRDEAIKDVHKCFPALSYVELGKIFGNRDHTSIIAALKRTGSYQRTQFRQAAE